MPILPPVSVPTFNPPQQRDPVDWSALGQMLGAMPAQLEAKRKKQVQDAALAELLNKALTMQGTRAVIPAVQRLDSGFELAGKADRQAAKLPELVADSSLINKPAVQTEKYTSSPGFTSAQMEDPRQLQVLLGMIEDNRTQERERLKQERELSKPFKIGKDERFIDPITRETLFEGPQTQRPPEQKQQWEVDKEFLDKAYATDPKLRTAQQTAVIRNFEMKGIKESRPLGTFREPFIGPDGEARMGLYNEETGMRIKDLGPIPKADSLSGAKFLQHRAGIATGLKEVQALIDIGGIKGGETGPWDAAYRETAKYVPWLSETDEQKKQADRAAQMSKINALTTDIFKRGGSSIQNKILGNMLLNPWAQEEVNNERLEQIKTLFEIELKELGREKTPETPDGTKKIKTSGGKVFHIPE